MMSEDRHQYHASDVDLAGDADDGNWSIRCLDVHKRLGGVSVLDGLNVAFPEDKITVVLGPSGTGKSVLIKHIIGLMFPDSGDVVVKGKSVKELTMPELLAMRRKIGVLFQDGALFGSMNVFDNVAFPLRQHTDYSEGEIAERVRERLERRRPGGRDGRPALAALRRHAQARRLRARARDGAGHRDLRRARLGSGPGAHRAAVRPDPGDAPDPQRHLHRRHPQHRLGAPDRRIHRGAVARADRRSGRRRARCSPRRTRSCASSSAGPPRGR